jgi:hypothetical protein
MLSHCKRLAILALLLTRLSPLLLGREIAVRGRVKDLQGRGVPNASVQLIRHNPDGKERSSGQSVSGPDGRFEMRAASAGSFDIKIEAAGFRQIIVSRSIHPNGNNEIIVRMRRIVSHAETVTVTADVIQTDVFSPDPAEKVFVREDLLDANPGRPGAPVSIPGYPIETAASGIKAPQYFAPGVAGDHGEPIAQYIAVGSYLVPNNLSANAHGNGYSDPNIFIPEVLETVQVDGGAFDVREGNHSVNLAATYGLRSRLDPFITLTGDARDIDVAAGLSPTPESWVAVAASFGNGFLNRLEHRQQYKLNGKRMLRFADHRLTLFGVGYYGFSYVPGLVPISAVNAADAGFRNYGDTIDPRQKDQTHTGLVALNDVWQLGRGQQLELSGFFRTYSLSLFSDFGQGLIRQSEFRTVAGGSANYVSKIAEYFSLLGGLDYEREAPRRDDLDHYGFYNPSTPAYYGPFHPVDGNNVTLGFVTPYVAAAGSMSRYLRYYLGWRREQIDVENQDLLRPQNSFQKWVGINSPKATISFLPRESWHAPLLALSFGQAFFTEDPRMGSGTNAGTPVATSHSYQFVASKSLRKTDLRLTLGHVTSSAELAKIDPDTGLQFNQGPGRLRFMTVAARQDFRYGSLLATFSKADARDLNSGQPTPEAPRTLFDLLGTVRELPFRLQARGEFEYVGTKPLGTGCLPDLNAECTGTPVKEVRGAVVRPFWNGRMDAGINFLIARGYTGQTTENFFPSEVQEVVGVRMPSYAAITVSYRFGRSHAP